MNATLGRLESVPLRQVWPLEARDFTPWLADPENLSLLADTLQLGELELQGTEVRVGNFKLDVLARDIEGHIVLVENQFGPTDHTHLGQILTYLAGQEGNATVIWIAEKFKEEHRAAIDWLNASTLEIFAFFAVEVEALKIGDSAPAPRFNVVSKPNEWSRDTMRSALSTGNAQLDDRAKAYVSYWAGFGEFMKDRGAPYKIPRPPRDYWCGFGIGRTGFALCPIAGFRDRKLGVELNINHRAAKRAFDILRAEQAVIDSEFGGELEWHRMNEYKGCKIGIYRTDLDPRDENQRPTQYEWLLDRMRRFSQAFGYRIRSLQLNDTADTDSLPETAAATAAQ